MLPCVSVQPIIAKTLPISQDRTIHYVGGVGPGNYSTISQAIYNASDGEIIYIYPGIYKEILILNKQLTLIGHELATTRIQSNVTTLTITANNCSISWLTISGGSQGIHLTTAQYTTIANNHITGCTRGITIEALIFTPSFTNIKDNTFTNNDYGVSIHAGLINIYNNEFSNNLRGLDHKGILCNIAFNHIENGTDGIKIGGYLNNVGRNAINHNSIGILVFGHGNNIHHNNFISNQDNSYLESAFVNRFLNNYWTKPRMAPYPIRGVVPIPGGNEIVYYDFDPFPRLIPNTIL
jgi:parallel beta-helix repeat protein